MNIDQAEYRYNNDANFYQLVKTFYQFTYELTKEVLVRTSTKDKG